MQKPDYIEESVHKVSARSGMFEAYEVKKTEFTGVNEHFLTSVTKRSDIMDKH
jgi:hypothetical protein